MGLLRNVLAVMALMVAVWGSLILVSYLVSVTVFYTLEHLPSNVLLSVLRVVMGLAVAAGWAFGWYLLTKTWLYRVLLSRRRGNLREG